MLEVKIERIPQKNEKRLLFPTVKLVETSLQNAGYIDGIWTLKMPRKIRKKGSERFRAIRIEGNGIKIRCKPGGNETRYEWVLFAPEKYKNEDVFSALCSLHPTTIMPIRSFIDADSKIVSNLFKREIDRKPVLVASSSKKLVEENSSESAKETKPENVSFSATEISKELNKREKEIINSLDISNLQDSMSSDEAISRALIVFSIFSENNFVKRSKISKKIIEHLNLKDLVKISPIYSSIPAAMRAMMMSLCKRGFVERVIHNKKTSGFAGGSTAGYRITERGIGRLKTIKLEPGLREKIDQKEIEPEPISPKPRPAQTIDSLKNLISEYDSLTTQIEEYKELIDSLTTENKSEIEISDLLTTKKKERYDLDKEIKNLEQKLEEIKKLSSKNVSDINELNKEMNALIERKKLIEESLS